MSAVYTGHSSDEQQQFEKAGKWLHNRFNPEQETLSYEPREHFFVLLARDVVLFAREESR